MKLLAFAVVLLFSPWFTTADVDPLADVTAAIDAFAFTFFKTLDFQDENMTYSQLGIAMALGMILRGANGQTAEEIKNLLAAKHISTDDIHAKLLRLLNDELNKPRNDLTLRVGNMALVSKDVSIKDDYLKFIQNNYHGVVKSVDFKNDGQNVVSNVNSFVANKTLGLVKNTLSSPLSPDTKLALVNSVYLKGSWVTPFPKANTHAAPFNNVDKSVSQVDTMHVVLNLKVCRFPGTKASLFTLPLKGKAVFMIFLPDEVNGLANTLAVVQPWALHKCLAAAKEQKTNLFFPKIRVEGQTNMETALRNLGVVSMLDQSKADLSGISNDKPLWVNQLVHKVVLNIGEDGVDADAANTGASQKSSPGFDKGAKTIRVNRPFGFGVYDFVHNMVVLADVVNKL